MCNKYVIGIVRSSVLKSLSAGGLGGLGGLGAGRAALAFAGLGQ